MEGGLPLPSPQLSPSSMLVFVVIGEKSRDVSFHENVRLLGGLGRGALFKRSIPPEREKRERGKRNGIRNANARKEGNGTDRRAVDQLDY